MKRGRTRIIAHRGDSRNAPQNTLPAIRSAIAEGSDGFETDIHETNDGSLVICHNYSIDKTSDGKGRISDMTLADLIQYDFGRYFSPEFQGTKIPGLEEIFKLVAKSPERTAIMDLELKPPKSGESDLVEKLISLIKKYGFEDKCYISSFDEKILRHVKEVDSAIKTIYIYPQIKNMVSQHLFVPYELLFSIKADGIAPHFRYMSRRRIQRCQALGIKVFPWTVNSDSAIRKMKRWRCDGIITDVPDRAKFIVNRG